VQFPNGREVKARDFKYSFERVLNPGTKSPNTWVFDKVVGASEFLEGRAGEVKGFKVKSDYVFEIIPEKTLFTVSEYAYNDPCLCCSPGRGDKVGR